MDFQIILKFFQNYIFLNNFFLFLTMIFYIVILSKNLKDPKYNFKFRLSIFLIFKVFPGKSSILSISIILNLFKFLWFNWLEIISKIFEFFIEFFGAFLKIVSCNNLLPIYYLLFLVSIKYSGYKVWNKRNKIFISKSSKNSFISIEKSLSI